MPVDVSDEDLDAAYSEWEREALILAGAYTDVAVKEAWEAAFQDVAKAWPNRQDLQAQEFMRRYHFTAIRRISSDERSRIRRVLLDAVRDGLGAEATSRVLRDALDARRARLRAIARTELNRGANWGRLQGYLASGVVDEVEWVATNDDRVRPDHWESNGNRTKTGQPFPGPGVSRGLVAPPAGVNCRCTIIPRTDLEELLAAKPRRFRDEFPWLEDLQDDYEDELDASWTRLGERLEAAVKRL